EDVTLLDLGERLFRGLPAPLRVLQVCHAGLPRDFPEIRSARPSTSMPSPSTSFVDPRGYADQAQAALEEGRLVTLIGPGGVGKSRLAIETSSGMTLAFRDGIRWVNLAPVDQPDLSPHAIASDLQVGLSSTDALETVIDCLRDTEALLVLDNCEHQLESVRRVVGTVLQQCPGVKILATSRERLRVADERVLNVEPLAEPNDPGLLDVAVDLFLSVARAAGASVTDDAQ